MTMTQTHGYWTDEGINTVYFEGYPDLDTYSGVDCRFLISIPVDEWIEEKYNLPHFVAEGTITDDVPTFTKTILTREDLEPLEDAGSWVINNDNDVDVIDTLVKLGAKAND